MCLHTWPQVAALVATLPMCTLLSTYGLTSSMTSATWLVTDPMMSSMQPNNNLTQRPNSTIRLANRLDQPSSFVYPSTCATCAVHLGGACRLTETQTKHGRCCCARIKILCIMVQLIYMFGVFKGIKMCT